MSPAVRVAPRDVVFVVGIPDKCPLLMHARVRVFVSPKFCSFLVRGRCAEGVGERVSYKSDRLADVRRLPISNVSGHHARRFGVKHHGLLEESLYFIFRYIICIREDNIWVNYMFSYHPVVKSMTLHQYHLHLT